MSLIVLFKDAVGDLMLANGFRYKNQAYYRINGDGIFQMLSVWNRASYKINLVNAPIWALEYWSHQAMKYIDTERGIKDLGYNLKNFAGENLKRIDEFGMTLFSNNMYYQSSEEEKTALNFTVLRQMLETDILHALDATVDFPSYFLWRTSRNKTEPSMGGWFNLEPIDLCVKAYTDGEAETAMAVLDKLLECRVKHSVRLFIQDMRLSPGLRELIRWQVNAESEDERKSLRREIVDSGRFDGAEASLRIVTDYKYKEELRSREVKRNYYRMFTESYERNDFSWVPAEMQRGEADGKRLIEFVLGEKALDRYNVK